MPELTTGLPILLQQLMVEILAADDAQLVLCIKLTA